MKIRYKAPKFSECFWPWMKNHKSDKPSKVLIASLRENLRPQNQGAKEEVPPSCKMLNRFDSSLQVQTWSPQVPSNI